MRSSATTILFLLRRGGSTRADADLVELWRAAFDSSPLLQRAPKLTLRSSLECARMKLWDEERGCMVGFPE